MAVRLLLIFFIFGFQSIYAQNRYTGRNFASRSEVIAKHGMVATSQPLATQVALDILKKGGSAVDAAIAANAMLGLVEPTGCGMGGDLFALIWDSKTERLYGLNASGRSPKELTTDHFKKLGMKSIPTYGALSVSTPGCVDGWFEMHRKFGKLAIKEILQPTVTYAREGFAVTEVISFLWQEYTKTLSSYTEYNRLYMPKGRAPLKGEVFKNEDLANTLEQVIKNGRDGFYKGRVAATIESSVKSLGGFLSKEDLLLHHAEWVEPITINYRGYDVWELPPNAQGIAVLQMLNILENYDLRSFGFGSPQHLHLLTEAKKIAFEDLAQYVADPAFVSLPIAQLISKKYAKGRGELIQNEKASSYSAGTLEAGSNTIYLTVADGEGNMVSLIQSNFAGMGSGIVPNRLGFSLQNRGCSFNLEPGHFNSYAPGKRPFHTLIPAFITKDKKPFISFGVMGADMQPQGQVQIIVNLIDFDMNLQEAGDAPRISHIGSTTPTGESKKGTGELRLESGFSRETILELLKMGHKTGYDLRGFGGYQAIRFDAETQMYFGASDSRKDGYAAGY